MLRILDWNKDINFHRAVTTVTDKGFIVKLFKKKAQSVLNDYDELLEVPT